MKEKELIKENRITIRLNDYEKEWIEAGATLNQMSTAEFVRKSAIEAIKEDILSEMFLDSYDKYEEEKDKYISIAKYL